MLEVKMTINSEKKHSIRYDGETNGAIASLYILKSGLVKPYPQKIIVRVQPDA